MCSVKTIFCNGLGLARPSLAVLLVEYVLPDEEKCEGRGKFWAIAIISFPVVEMLR